MAMKDFRKGDGLVWYFHGQPNRHGLNKIYVDHLVPKKGWRVVYVYKYQTREDYYPTRAEAIKSAKDFMK